MSKLIINLIRNRHWFKGQFKAPIVDKTFDVIAFREQITTSSLKIEKIPADINIEKVDIDGINGEWIRPDRETDDRIIFYIHGGGFISGDCNSHRGHMVKLANATGKSILQFNYRLAPEHPYPAAIDDCVIAYQWLIDQGYQGSQIVVGGESAGGSLTLALMHRIEIAELEKPLKCFSISPVTDLSCKAKSFEDNWKKDIAPYNSWTIWTQYYVGQAAYNKPDLSPHFADVKKHPPLLLIVGTHEIHYDDCVAYASKCKEAGATVDFYQWSNMVHAFPLMSPLFKEARDAYKVIVDYINA